MKNSKLITHESFSLSYADAIDFQIRTSWFSISRMYNELALARGLSVSSAFILLNIGKKGINPTKIGPSLGMQANSPTRILKTLEEKGLIERRKGGNGREVLIFLTEKGLEYKKIASKIVADFNELLYQKIPAEQLLVFYEVLFQVHDGIREMREKLGIEDDSTNFNDSDI